MCDITTPAITAPMDGAAYKIPSSAGPTCKISLANIGKSAVAEPKRVTKKSKIIVDQIRVLDFTNDSPSFMEPKDNTDVPFLTLPWVFIKITDAITARYDTAFIA